MADPLMFISIALELGVFIILSLAAWKGKGELTGLAGAFGVFTIYHAALVQGWPIPAIMLNIFFFLGSWGSLWSAWKLYMLKPKPQ